MSDLDEDLLALAGEGSGAESSDEETKLIPQKRGQASRSGGGKRQRTGVGENSSEEEDKGDFNGDAGGGVGGEFSDEDLEELALGKQDTGAGGESEEEVFVNPYPLENKYKDAADRAYLNGLAEIERESILFDRSQEVEKYNQQMYLAQRAKERRQQEQARAGNSTRVSTRDKSGSSTKQSKLSELKKKREEKKSRQSGRPSVPYRGEGESSEEEEDDDEKPESESENESEYSDEPGKVEWDEPKKAREITVNDLNKIRFGRTLFSKFCHNPGFSDTVVGTFVRINIGYDRAKQQTVYRICEVKGLQRTKPYKFLNRTADESIVVASGRNERAFEMGICSDSPFTEDEFRWWKHSLLKDEIALPSAKKIERKLQELVAFKKRDLTPEEVNELIQRRQALSNSTGVAVVLEKTTLQQQRAIALEQGDLDKVEELDAQIAAIERKISSASSKVQSPLDKLAAVNQRNRRVNQIGIRRAELKATEDRRKTAGSASAGNPFSRLKTNARVFYESEADRAASKARQAEEEELARKTAQAEKERLEKEKAAAATRKSSLLASNEVDDMIAQIDIRLEIEI